MRTAIEEKMLKAIGFIIGLLMLAAAVGPVVYHVVWCIQAAAETGSAIALLIAGIVFPPLGWVHGVSLMFGATWI